MKNIVTEEDIKKWLNKIEPVLEKLIASNDKGEELIRNINAYVNDSKHFFEEKNLVLSFESMVWAWALFETGVELGAIHIEEH